MVITLWPLRKLVVPQSLTVQKSLEQKLEGHWSIPTCPGVISTGKKVQALAELKRDSSKVILTADKGVALVIMDQPDYTNKAQELLGDKKTYKEINTDPTNKLKTKRIRLLKKIKAERGNRRPTIQEDVPHWGCGTKILWAT